MKFCMGYWYWRDTSKTTKNVLHALGNSVVIVINQKLQKICRRFAKQCFETPEKCLKSEFKSKPKLKMIYDLIFIWLEKSKKANVRTCTLNSVTGSGHINTRRTRHGNLFPSISYIHNCIFEWLVAMYMMYLSCASCHV